MSLKKFRAKTHKTTKKRIKVTNGGDLSKGKLLINRPNRQHRMIGKSRSRVLKGKKSTVLSAGHTKFRTVI
jgi:ribosomal protein L35